MPFLHNFEWWKDQVLLFQNGPSRRMCAEYCIGVAPMLVYEPI